MISADRYLAIWPSRVLTGSLSWVVESPCLSTIATWGGAIDCGQGQVEGCCGQPIPLPPFQQQAGAQETINILRGRLQPENQMMCSLLSSQLRATGEPSMTPINVCVCEDPKYVE